MTQNATDELAWTELLSLVQSSLRCSRKHALERVASAIAGHALTVRWQGNAADAAQTLANPPFEAQYWLEAISHPQDLDCLVDPLVWKIRRIRRAPTNRFKRGQFRKPFFPRAEALRMCADMAAQKAAFPARESIETTGVSIGVRKAGRRTRREDALNVLGQLEQSGEPLPRGDRQLAAVVAKRLGAELDKDPGYSLGTLMRFIRIWKKARREALPDPMD